MYFTTNCQKLQKSTYKYLLETTFSMYILRNSVPRNTYHLPYDYVLWTNRLHRMSNRQTDRQTIQKRSLCISLPRQLTQQVCNTTYAYEKQEDITTSMSFNCRHNKFYHMALLLYSVIWPLQFLYTAQLYCSL